MLIGELAERARTTTRALRYYEEQGLLSPRRSPNGYRIYEDSAVTAVQQIRALLAAGFPSSTVGLLLPCTRGTEPTIELCPMVTAEMQRVLAALDAEVTAKLHQRAAVAELLAPTGLFGADLGTPAT